MFAIEIRQLRKRYESHQAINDINLSIEEGEFFGLLGKNGAGKTTLINILAGLVRVDKGSVSVLGFDIAKNFRAARRSLGIVPQELVFDPFFTVHETLRIQSGYFGLKKNDKWIDEVMMNLDLTKHANANMRTLSGGVKRSVLIAQALIHRPPIIVLDEPTSGIDIELRKTLWKFITLLNAKGHTIILTTHYLEEAQSLCGRIAILKDGRVVALDRTKNLLYHFSGLKLYLHIANGGLLPIALRSLEINSIKHEPGEYLLHLKNYDEVEKILSQCRSAGCTFNNIEVRKGDLEDVFIQIMNEVKEGDANQTHDTFLVKNIHHASPGGLYPRNRISVSNELSYYGQQSSSSNSETTSLDLKGRVHQLPFGSGFLTLLYKEVMRFWKVSFQTVFSPIVSSLLYLSVFGRILPNHIHMEIYNGIEYASFLLPGLVMMSILQNSFANSSSSLIQSKISGNLLFVLLTPISCADMFFAYVLAAVVRGLVVGGCVFTATILFVSIKFSSPLFIVLFAFFSSLILGTLGLIAGIWAEKFDQLAVFQNFFIMPLTFLSGVFYSTHLLPPIWRNISRINPFFYMIDGFRYGFFGFSDVNPLKSLLIVAIFFIILALFAMRQLSISHKLRY